MAITRLSGGLTPGNGSDPRTFPAIWNATADIIEGLDLNDLADVSAGSPLTGQVLEWSGTAWVNGQVDAAGIASDAVTTAKILDDAVTTVKIVDGAVTSAKLSTGTILQVVQTLKTDTFTSTSDTYEDVTGASVTITPRATSSKVLILGSVAIGSTTGSAGRSAFVRLSGGNTSAYIGDTAGNRVPALGSPGSQQSEYRIQHGIQNAPIAFLDSPATTSATTYNIQVRRGGGDTAVIGRSGLDTDSNGFGRYPTTLIAMEVAG